MKIITLIALLMINLSLFAKDDFNKVTQILITINGQKIESVLVEVDGRKLFTNEEGFVYVDLKQLFDIKVNDSTGFIQLKVED